MACWGFSLPPGCSCPPAPSQTHPHLFPLTTGTDASSVEAGSDGAAKLCEAVARVALENATNCAVTSVTDVTNGASGGLWGSLLLAQ